MYTTHLHQKVKGYIYKIMYVDFFEQCRDFSKITVFQRQIDFSKINC